VTAAVAGPVGGIALNAALHAPARAGLDVGTGHKIYDVIDGPWVKPE
jgi:hypothetical protein